MERTSLAINTKLYNLSKRVNDRIYSINLHKKYNINRVRKFKQYSPIKSTDMCLEDYLKTINHESIHSENNKR
jgi:hypothetical protein